MVVVPLLDVFLVMPFSVRTCLGYPMNTCVCVRKRDRGTVVVPDRDPDGVPVRDSLRVTSLPVPRVE